MLKWFVQLLNKVVSAFLFVNWFMGMYFVMQKTLKNNTWLCIQGIYLPLKLHGSYVAKVELADKGFYFSLQSNRPGPRLLDLIVTLHKRCNQIIEHTSYGLTNVKDQTLNGPMVPYPRSTSPIDFSTHAIVVLELVNNCPYSNSYMPRAKQRYFS